jgi:hypothetical protein
LHERQHERGEREQIRPREDVERATRIEPAPSVRTIIRVVVACLRAKVSVRVVLPEVASVTLISPG